MIPLLAAISLRDPQVWVTTAIVLVAAGLLLRSWIGPRKKPGCGGCAPKRPDAGKE